MVQEMALVAARIWCHRDLQEVPQEAQVARSQLVPQQVPQRRSAGMFLQLHSKRNHHCMKVG
jgi:hypothetical protein